MRTKSLLLLFAFLMSIGYQVQAQNEKAYKPAKKKFCLRWDKLLDKDLSDWEVWTGVADPSTKNLPEGYTPSKKMKVENAIGLGDPLNIYTVSGKGKNKMLKISGVAYAGLTSKKEYENYHFTMLFKWGEKKYAPRLDRIRDCGLLYHCYGDHGAFWGVWKRCLESQIQEGDFGDLYTLQGTSAKVRVNADKRWDPKSETIEKNGKRGPNMEGPHGAWTRVDIYVLGDKSLHVVNGKVVLALSDAKDHEGNPLTKGQIQIQSEGAECYAKDICIRPIKKFPKKLLKQTALQMN